MLRATCTAILATALLTSTATAQAGEGSTIGIGIALNPTAIVGLDDDVALLPMGFGNFTVPINIGSRVRLEPELGIFRAKAEFSSPNFSGESVQSILRLGVGLHFMLGGSESFRPYIGPRAGLVLTSDRDEFTGGTPDEDERTDNYVGLAIGGEYWFSPRFSLGGELQINRVALGDEESPPDPSYSTSYSLITNNGVIAVRLYLF